MQNTFAFFLFDCNLVLLTFELWFQTFELHLILIAIDFYCNYFPFSSFFTGGLIYFIKKFDLPSRIYPEYIIEPEVLSEPRVNDLNRNRHISPALWADTGSTKQGIFRFKPNQTQPNQTKPDLQEL